MNLLIVEDESNFREILVNELPDTWRKFAAASLAEGRRLLNEQNIDVVVLDLRLPDGSGLDLLKEMRQRVDPPEVFVLTGHGSVPEAVEAMRLGVFDFVTKPVGLDRVENLIRAAGLRRGLAVDERARDTQFADRFLPPNLRALGRQVANLARTDIPILILGESGVGKDRFAQFIHRLSARSAEPYVTLNCAAIPENLLESELFGFEKGAFTGAVTAKPGFIETAHAGTLFLDEIAELSLPAQAKLLRTLDTGEYYRVGSVSPHKADIRFVAATNKDLKDMIQDERFREDFFFRINGFCVRIPPLRERPEDVAHISREQLSRMGKQLEPSAIMALAEHPWPGNVRELLLVLQRAVALSAGTDTIAEADIRTALGSEFRPRCDRQTDYSLESAVRRHIRSVLEVAEGNQAQAARLLGIDPKTLYRKLKDMKEDG